jgi:hypothetical protein
MSNELEHMTATRVPLSRIRGWASSAESKIRRCETEWGYGDNINHLRYTRGRMRCALKLLEKASAALRDGYNGPTANKVRKYLDAQAERARDCLEEMDIEITLQQLEP